MVIMTITMYINNKKADNVEMDCSEIDYQLKESVLCRFFVSKVGTGEYIGVSIQGKIL